MSETDDRFDFDRDRSKIDEAIDNIEWAKSAHSEGDVLKGNAHLHRAKELLEEYKNKK